MDGRGNYFRSAEPLHHNEKDVERMLTRLEVRERVSHLAWLERCVFEDDDEPSIHCKLEFAPETVRELERTPTGWTCLLFMYYQLPALTPLEAERSAERFRRFAPLPKWLPWFDYPLGEPRLPTAMLRVRIETGDMALIDEWRYDPEDLAAGRHRV